MKSAVVFNLGCKVNQYESNELMQGLSERGFLVSDGLSYADLYIINTCAVTVEAERKSRQAIERCRKFNKDAEIIVCGCASQKNIDAFKKDNVVFVVGTNGKDAVFRHIDDFVNPHGGSAAAGGVTASRTRAYVKIQDGCNNACSYCIVPSLRGKSRSRMLDEIIREINSLAKTEKEIVLTGINLMQYEDLPKLINAMSDIDTRVRIGSIYAEGLTKEVLLALFSLKNFCPHFHLSLQSGSDAVLKAMNRRYTTREIADKIAEIRSFDKNAFIAADIIVGFPTETNENFRETYDFLAKSALSDLHIFPFSPREGTEAFKLKPLPVPVLKSRVAALTHLRTHLKDAYLKKNIGVAQSVLFEEDGAGYSQYYLRVYASSARAGEIQTVIPKNLYKDGLS